MVPLRQHVLLFLLFLLSSLIYAFLVCHMTRTVDMWCTSANKYLFRICHIGAVFALVWVDCICVGVCVTLCIIFKTFNAFNVCKFIIIIIIFKMDAREHGDFSCYQDKRSSKETPQQTLQDKIPLMPCNNLIISLLITSKFAYIHINIWSNACKNHPRQSNWRGSICPLNQMKWLTQIHYPKFP